MRVPNQVLLEGCGTVLGHGECCSFKHYCERCEDEMRRRGMDIPEMGPPVPLEEFTDWASAPGPSLEVEE